VLRDGDRPLDHFRRFPKDGRRAEQVPPLQCYLQQALTKRDTQ